MVGCRSVCGDSDCAYKPDIFSKSCANGVWSIPTTPPFKAHKLRGSAWSLGVLPGGKARLLHQVEFLHDSGPCGELEVPLGVLI